LQLLALDDDHAKILKRVGATEIIHPERDMALRVSKGLSRPNILDFIPLAEEFDLIQVGPPREFIGKSLMDLNLRAKKRLEDTAERFLVHAATPVISFSRCGWVRPSRRWAAGCRLIVSLRPSF